tara:strand:- start:8700 stop:9224 length:525 start_codon:yes stop_codon:yes gene_type:complete
MSEKYAYEQLLEEHELNVSDLPADAKLGIKQIQRIANAKKMTEARGQNVSQDVLDKIRSNDKWVSREIIDFMNDIDSSNQNLPAPAPDVISQIKKEEAPELSPEQQLGLKIENELSFLFDNFGNAIISVDDIKPAKLTYSTIFDNYDNGGQNGISTSNFSLIETEENNYKLQKN